MDFASNFQRKSSGRLNFLMVVHHLGRQIRERLVSSNCSSIIELNAHKLR